MFSLDIEILGAAFLPVSVDGGLPDTLVQVTVLPTSSTSTAAATNSSPANDQQQCTSIVYQSREPKWAEKMIFNTCNKEETLLIQVLERAVDLKLPLRVLGEHKLVVGGLRRQFGCAWVAMKVGCLDDESPFPIPDCVCVRLAWSLVPVDAVNSYKSLGEVNAPFVTTTLIRQPKAAAAVANSVNESHVSVVKATENDNATGALDGAWKQRIESLEQRVDHLDSLFRTRRDYEAEVQRVMMEQAMKEHQDATSSGSSAQAALSGAGMATTPSLAVALLTSKERNDLVRSCQPKLMSVAATTSPWNIYQSTSGALSGSTWESVLSKPSAASHFPLSSIAASGSSSALQSILLQPTVVSTQDIQILESSTYKHVQLPKPRMIGFIAAPQKPSVNPVVPALTARSSPATLVV